MNNPLVSIIVRTKDRPKLLKRALQSIAAQTYRPIEVVLVNDGGCDLDIGEIRSILGDVSLNYQRLEENRGRAHAGNVGIENSEGEYIGFLDDDDEYYPGHVETLAGFLMKSDYDVAYTDTEMVTLSYDSEGKEMMQVENYLFSKDFSYEDLLLSNYIPFNSIMFSRKVIDSDKMLDEEFELYEDWNLLIRLGENNIFHHIQETTARYYQWDKEQQINKKNPLYMEEARKKIIEKYYNKKIMAQQDELKEHKAAHVTPEVFSEKQSLVSGQMMSEYELYIAALKELEESDDVKREKASLLSYRPKISVITPVFNVREIWLRLAIESVLNQIYTNFELCICDGGSNEPYIKKILEEYALRDSRIKLKMLNENQGISGNSNEALSLATGEFVCFLDHDDELPPDALYEVCSLLNEDRGLDFIYTDEDKITEEGKRFEPHFKPDWAPDSFRSYNYITHLSVVRKSIVDSIGGFRIGFDGSQDYDLFLRVVEKTQKIAHIPKVLYHWRSHSLSAAGHAEAKMYAYDSAKKALKDHIDRLGLEGEIYDGPFLGLYRAKYSIKGTPEVTIVIPTKDHVAYLKKCIDSIFRISTYSNYNILIVDNQSSQDDTFIYYSEIEKADRIRIVKYDKPFNYSAINNFAVRCTDTEFLIFLNNDTEVISPDWIESMLEFAQRDDVGAVGALLLYHDNTIQHAGIILGLYKDIGNPFHKMLNDSIGYFGRNKIIQNMSAVRSVCMMTKKSVFNRFNGFDEKYYHAYSDIDFCLKARENGLFVIYTPYAQLYHHESITTDSIGLIKKHKLVIEGKEVFYNKWGRVIEEGDPYYNFNLTRLSELFSIKRIPELISDKKDSVGFYYGLIDAYRSQLFELIKQNNLEAILKLRDVHTNNLEAILKHMDVHTNNLEAILKHRDVHVANLEAILKHRDVHVANLEAILKHRDMHIGNIESMLKEKISQIENIEMTIHDKDTTLNNIYSSRGWKVLSLYYRVRDNIFPLNSFRRRFVKSLSNLIIKPIRFVRSVQRLQKKENNESWSKQTEKRFICGIESDFTQPLIVGKGNVFYLTGWCYHTKYKIKRLNVVVGSRSYNIHNFCIARPDVLAEQSPEIDHSGNSLNSGFWYLIPFTEIDSPCYAILTLNALLENGEQCKHEIGSVPLVPSWERESDNRFRRLSMSSEPLIAICMTAYNPEEKVLRRQVDSIIHQSYKNWICIISDDCSRRDIYERICEIASIDERFFITRNSVNLGFYNNFERCLQLVPQEAKYIAFSDQDDCWHADKLYVLLSRFDESTLLAYSDMNIVNERGNMIHNTYWTTRKNNYRHLDSLLFANTITGAASMIKSDMLPYLLPFPKKIGDSYHDHWMACVALSKGSIAYIDRPLYDYYQHQDNIIGHYTRSNAITFHKIKEAFNKVIVGLKSGQITQHIKTLMWHSREVYMNDIIRIILIANVLLLRCGDTTRYKKIIIKQFAGFETSACGLLIQGIKGMLMRRSTLGAEFYCFRNVLVYKLMNYYYRQKKEKFLSRQTGLVSQKASPVSSDAQSIGPIDVIKQKIAPLNIIINAEAKKRLNLLIPTIDFRYFFGGYIGKFNFALRLVDFGYAVRIVIVDYCNYDLSAWKMEIKGYKGLENFFDVIEVAYIFDRNIPLEVSQSDAFIATTWWTAHIAHKAVSDMKIERFMYLIQEYEPFTFPMGTFNALAQQTYRFQHYAVFSTEFLRDYFRLNKIGVYLNNEEQGEDNSVYFENAIQTFTVNEQDMKERKIKRFLYYARPEQHAARNMFELGVLALNSAIEDGCFRNNQWEFYGIGSVSNIESIRLSDNVSMKFLQKLTLKEYAELLPGFDVGLSLMFTPHPSLPPIEMAAAGLIVVTNTFANKTDVKLRQISSNIIAVDPTLDGVRQGIAAALSRIDDYKSRIEGANVKWSKNWTESFDYNFITKIKNFCRVQAL